MNSEQLTPTQLALIAMARRKERSVIADNESCNRLSAALESRFPESDIKMTIETGFPKPKIGRPPVSEEIILDYKPIPQCVLHLHDAIYRNSIKEVRALITIMSLRDITTEDVFHDTALGLALKWRRTEIVKLLKAKINETMEGRVYA